MPIICLQDLDSLNLLTLFWDAFCEIYSLSKLRYRQIYKFYAPYFPIFITLLLFFISVQLMVYYY